MFVSGASTGFSLVTPVMNLVHQVAQSWNMSRAQGWGAAEVVMVEKNEEFTFFEQTSHKITIHNA